MGGGQNDIYSDENRFRSNLHIIIERTKAPVFFDRSGPAAKSLRIYFNCNSLWETVLSFTVSIQIICGLF